MTLREYDVMFNGHKTTVQLSDQDAKAQGLFKEPAKASAPPPKKAPVKAPANKAAPKPVNKSGGDAGV
jgi:hypothetical protein